MKQSKGGTYSMYPLVFKLFISKVFCFSKIQEIANLTETARFVCIVFFNRLKTFIRDHLIRNRVPMKQARKGFRPLSAM